MPIDIALGAVWTFVSPLLSDSLKNRLKPKGSPEKAKERAFRLYKSLGDVDSKTSAFVAELKKRIRKRPSELSPADDPLGEPLYELLLSLKELALALDAISPQLDVHKHELLQAFQDFFMRRDGVMRRVTSMVEAEKALKVRDLKIELANAEENATRLHSAMSEFRSFLASEFSFKESF